MPSMTSALPWAPPWTSMPTHPNSWTPTTPEPPAWTSTTGSPGCRTPSSRPSLPERTPAVNSAVGPRNSITDVAGVLVGHHHKLDPGATIGSGAATGCTVVRVPGGATAAVDVRGGGPGTRETDLLDPGN